jgi:hypothetical protein
MDTTEPEREPECEPQPDCEPESEPEWADEGAPSTVYVPGLPSATLTNSGVQSTIPLLGAPDYREWLAMFDIISDTEKNRKFKRDVIPCLSDYAEGTSFTAALHDHSWLRDFINPDVNFAATLRELDYDANRATIILADFIKHLAGTVITLAWQENMKSFTEKHE